jgi:inner membrane protein
MGEAFAGKKLGTKAMLWGAMAQSIPDIDVVSSLWMNTTDNLLAHRGFTHSFLFVALITPVFGLLAERWHRPHNISLRTWISFFGAVIFIHVFLDAFNNYGVGWWEPFSHKRISFNAIYVADPFFSVWPGIAVMLILIRHDSIKWKQMAAKVGLIMSLIYLMYCSINKYFIDQYAKKVFRTEQLASRQYFTTPAPLQNWLWYIVTGDEKGFYVGFRSLFESGNNTSFQYFPRNDSLLNTIDHHEDLIKLKRFSQGFYTAERWGDTLVFNDLRFGQMIGWQSPRQRFVFHFYLNHLEDNDLVVQRGRFKYWDKPVIQNFIQRIFRPDE